VRGERKIGKTNANHYRIYKEADKARASIKKIQ
jgi:hypothetical protein